MILDNVARDGGYYQSGDKAYAGESRIIDPSTNAKRINDPSIFLNRRVVSRIKHTTPGVTMSNVTNIPLSEIRENTVALRSVDLEGEGFLQLVDSIRENGILSAVSVKMDKDPETGTEYFCLVDGLHRLTAAKEAGLSEIPAIIVEADEAKQLEMQIAANLHRVETKPCEYAAQLKRMLGLNQTWTVTELAAKLTTTPKWIKDRLSLNKLENDRLKELIDSGDIPLANAYAMARLPNEEVESFIEDAMTETADVFCARVQERINEVRDARRKGKEAATPTFVAMPKARKIKELKSIVDDPAIAQGLSPECGVDPDAFLNVIKWVLQLDEVSVSAAKAKFDEREAAKAERKRIREEEKAKKKAEKARKAAEEAEKAQAAISGE
jgi:ParB/RepB/Spo0J family partition protein